MHPGSFISAAWLAPAEYSVKRLTCPDKRDTPCHPADTVDRLPVWPL